MAGSWEILNNPSVLCGILHTDQTSIAWALGLRALQIPGPILPVAGMPYDMARNVICMKALEVGVDAVFILDSDVIPPPDAILRLLRHRQPVISGVYHRRSPPHGLPVMQRPVGQWVMNYPPNAIIEVDVVGSGCLLISTDVLRNLPPSRPGSHWFDWRVNLQGLEPIDGIPHMSEDFVFCMRVKQKLGIPILVDTGVQCKHVGLAQATYGRMDPCEAIPA